MRLSVPGIPVRASTSPNVVVPQIAAEDAAAKLLRWLQREDGRGRQGNALVITGAGVSVDSGIRAYRGAQGSYTIRKTYRPIFYGEFVASAMARKRYWARSYLGYPPVQHAQPNKTHYALAAIQALGWTKSLITQNVDRLHHKAAPDFARAEREILELHGSLKQIVCFSCSSTFPRDPFQDDLSKLNPGWHEYADKQARNALDPKLNPDGDVDLEGKSYDDFKVPRCYKCGEDSIRPNVVMFGQSLAEDVKKRSFDMVDSASSMLIVGSSMATYSAFRLLKSAADASKALCLLSVGESRGDECVPPGAGANEDDPRVLRLDIASTDVLTRVAAKLAETPIAAVDRSLVTRLLASGVTKSVDVGEPAS